MGLTNAEHGYISEHATHTPIPSTDIGILEHQLTIHHSTTFPQMTSLLSWLYLNIIFYVILNVILEQTQLYGISHWKCSVIRLLLSICR